jgi:hypothetical protein
MKVKFRITEVQQVQAYNKPFVDQLNVVAVKADQLDAKEIDPLTVHEIEAATIRFSLLLPDGRAKESAYEKGKEFYVEFTPKFI